MSGSSFDQLARAAAPVSRRRAVRIIGGTLLASAFPLLRPGRARGANCTAAAPQPCGGICCSEDALCCPDIPACCPPAQGTTDDGRPYTTTCGPAGPEQNNCASHIGCPKGTTGCGDGGGGAYIYATCCESSEVCQSGKCVGKCADGRGRCGGKCCPKGEKCIQGRCRKECKGGRVACGDKCCPKGERCVKGHCRKCPPHHRACGDKCCGKGLDCCDDDVRAICCDTRRRACCPVGRPGSQRITCCAPKTTCAPMIAPGDAGVTPDSPVVCCPPDRVVPFSGRDACCAPGYVSMGGKLVVPPGGGGGTCCQESKACGSGKDITCCGPNQTCQNGTCVGGA